MTTLTSSTVAALRRQWLRKARDEAQRRLDAGTSDNPEALQRAIAIANQVLTPTPDNDLWTRE